MNHCARNQDNAPMVVDQINDQLNTIHLPDKVKTSKLELETDFGSWMLVKKTR